MTDSLSLPLWLLVGVSAFYLGVPLLIRFQQRFSAHPKLDVIDLADLGPPVKQFLATQTDAVLKLGFDEPTLVHIPDAVPNVSSYLIMLVNRQTGDKAMVTVIIGSGPIPRQTAYVEFSTRFDSGEEFDTLNSSELMAFPLGPKTVRTHVPSVRDPLILYRLHTFVMSKHAPVGRKVVYDPGQALDHLTRHAFIETYEKQVQRGWLYYDQRQDVYWPTFKGAYLMTWGLLQPMKAMRRAILEKKARRVLEEFERARPNEPNGNIRA